jgi:uroporphyrinogen-III synthase
MAAILLILRPQPGAEATAARALKMGMEAVVAPLFEIVPVEWEAPDPKRVDAVVLTSANAPRQAGPQLKAFTHLPCYAVGEATAAAAQEAGFAETQAGPSDGAALIELLAAQGVERALHPCGRDNHPTGHRHVTLIRRIVYAAEPVDALPLQAAKVLANGALALLHSPRAAALFARLVSDKAGIAIAAISPAALAAAGSGWRLAASAAEPRDEALLELACKLCNTKRGEMGNGG